MLPLRRGYCWDVDRERALALARRYAKLPLDPVDAPAEAARASDVILCCTTSRWPYLTASCVTSGTFIAAVGADCAGKAEIDPPLMARSRVFTDMTDQCLVMGDLRSAVAAGTMRREDVVAELGQLVIGAARGRVDEAQITLFDSTGTALQDVAAAAAVYERAIARGGFRSRQLGAAA